MDAKQARRARIQHYMHGLALEYDEIARSNLSDSLLRTANKTVSDLNVESSSIRSEMENLKTELGVVKAQLDVSRTERNVLAERDAAASERYAELHKELDVARKEISEQQVAYQKLWEESQVLENEKKDAQLDLQRFRTAIPLIFNKAIQSADVMKPFEALCEAGKGVERMETINCLAGHVTLPDPLPEAFLETVDPDSYDKLERAYNMLKELKVPYVDRIASDAGLTVDDILSMEA